MVVAGPLFTTAQDYGGHGFFSMGHEIIDVTEALFPYLQYPDALTVSTVVTPWHHGTSAHATQVLSLFSTGFTRHWREMFESFVRNPKDQWEKHLQGLMVYFQHGYDGVFKRL